MHEPWQTFADNFAMYLADAVEQGRRKAKRDADDREQAVKNAAARREHDAKERWLRYQSIRGMSWSTMTDADREFIGEITGEPLTVSDEDFARVKDIEAREWAYKKTTRKYGLLKMFDRLGQLTLDDKLHLTSAAVEEVGRVRKLAEAASDNGPELEVYRRELLGCMELGRVKPPLESPEEPEE